jgi:hypothetical protein
MSKHLGVEKRERRFFGLDGMCFHCEEPANRLLPIGPITIKISMPHGGKEILEFCCWKCVSRWAGVRAGDGFVTEPIT